MTDVQLGTLIGAITAPRLGESYFRNLPQNDPIYFEVGSSLTSFTAYASGMFYLGFNDWAFPYNQPAVSDNAGFVTAVISEAANVPEPSTVVLLISGLLGLWIGRCQSEIQS